MSTLLKDFLSSHNGCSELIKLSEAFVDMPLSHDRDQPHTVWRRACETFGLPLQSRRPLCERGKRKETVCTYALSAMGYSKESPVEGKIGLHRSRKANTIAPTAFPIDHVMIRSVQPIVIGPSTQSKSINCCRAGRERSHPRYTYRTSGPHRELPESRRAALPASA